METFELLRSLLAEKVKENAEITPRTNLRELGIDSVDLVEILLNFEEKMNLTFEDEAMLKLSTVQDVLDLSQEIDVYKRQVLGPVSEADYDCGERLRL